jgi:ADP-ribosylglycohydrolase
MPLPHDYVERVYAGVLGKIIGVYLGRPFEGWSHERISQELGEINYYVHERFGTPLIVTDDDISGTFTFLRALDDYGATRGLTPAQIGQTWLNYIIERRTILWWGGMGNSTEHTAYLRLKHGVAAPQSGCMALNGQVVAEQIGAQIFIDGWAMVAPGDPELAADLARRAASVSHDGEAIYGAQVIAAMEAQAFVEPDLNRLLDCALSLIPNHSLIYRLIQDLRQWRAAETDWRKTRSRIEEKYGYDRYGGNCHIIPNHALVIHALLYGDDDFQKSLMIANTCGWDTDCNSGNVGCLLGIKNGLAGLDQCGPDWRGPIADRLYLPTADGGRAISDAVHEAYQIANLGRRLAGEPPLVPKDGARYHFSLPGAIQGFMAEESAETRGTVIVENAPFRRGPEGALAAPRPGEPVVPPAEERCLALHFRRLAPGRSARVATPTFIPSRETADYFSRRGYALLASPKLYGGQVVRAAVSAGAANARPVQCNLYVQRYGPDDTPRIVRSPAVALAAGERHNFAWLLEDQPGEPIYAVGVEIRSREEEGLPAGRQPVDGVLYLHWLTWDGAPDVTLRRPPHQGEMWRRAWVDAVDQYGARWPEAFRLAHNEGRGLLLHGARDWTDYQVEATITVHMASAAGIAARVQGLRRFYALLLCADGALRLVKALDGDRLLGEHMLGCRFGESRRLQLRVAGRRITALVDGQEIFCLEDNDRPLESGGVALVCEEGRAATDEVRVQPLRP